ncbi:MAG: CBS domain-containing protein [Deltaproteobacteria bacterium]|nr:CBS domain-containing protein [Deltaproteobacteria bacterium]MBI3389870.1 CBS domain-containing protein [Deltaproteobacteria bacterium]
MAEYDERLSAISDQLKNGVNPQGESVRAFLRWFGVERRGWRHVSWIRSVLARHKVATQPDFEYAYYYGQVNFIKAPNDAGDDVADPTVRLFQLEAANRAPVVVAPDVTLQKAVSQMLAHDFSQLPVMTGTRDVKGLISWKSIGSRLALGRQCVLVKDCMDMARLLPFNTSLFEAIEVVAAEDCVLVQALDKSICGIVTAADLGDQFRLLAEPFLLVGEIERGVRHVLHGKFSAKELEQARAPGDERAINGIADLTLGEYVRLVQDDTRWKKLSLAIDRAEFCSSLDRVRELRNDVMHFTPDGLEPSDMEFLRGFAKYLRRLRALGAL